MMIDKKETCGFCKKEFKRLSTHLRFCKERKKEDQFFDDISKRDFTPRDQLLPLSGWQCFKNWVRRLFRR